MPEGTPLFVAVASNQDWKAKELKARGEFKGVGQNNCQEVMKLDEPFWVEFFPEARLRRLALQTGFNVAETEIFTEPSGYRHLRETRPDNTYLFAQLIRRA